jgi:hypothetical protein
MSLRSPTPRRYNARVSRRGSKSPTSRQFDEISQRESARFRSQAIVGDGLLDRAGAVWQVILHGPEHELVAKCESFADSLDSFADISRGGTYRWRIIAVRYWSAAMRHARVLRRLMNGYPNCWRRSRSMCSAKACRSRPCRRRLEGRRRGNCHLGELGAALCQLRLSNGGARTGPTGSARVVIRNERARQNQSAGHSGCLWPACCH